MKRALVVVGILAAVLVPAVPAHAGGGCHDRSHTEAAGSSVDLKMNCFKPSVLSVEPGTTVTFTNRDDVEHAISGNSIDEWKTLDAGASTTQRYDTPGTYAYMCHLHPAMTGAVVVGTPALAAATQPIVESESDGGGVALLPIAAALVVGLVGGAVIAGRRVASSG